MLVVHHLGVSQSERIVWLCEELGIDYTLKVYDRDSVTRLAPADYKALHPMGMAPVIHDGDVVLGESGAIIDYINQKYGENRLALKPDDPHFADYLYWFHFANASLMAHELAGMIATMLGAGADNPAMALLADRRDRGFAQVEAHLGHNTWFAGPAFTAADIIMVFPLTTMRAFVPRDLGPYPNIRAYLKRVGERPAYRRAMQKGDPTLPPMLD
ncbi:glutathione S-transferase family protein [Zavarzinia sp. CC-PAN008]|uniref:glutathione S-transferase family protein n=1 Tax=Zavarzinia sp. CC-PAN008 TaxID=3243332 RepID=UPI003F747AAA